MQLSIYAIPAFLALFAKVVIFYYARKTGTRNFLTRLFVWLLVILSLQNVSEIALFASHAQNLIHPFGGVLYFSSVILALSMLLHIVLILVLDWPQSKLQQKITWWLYFPVIPLELLLWFTPWLISGFQITSFGYREIPGPVYFILEFYVFFLPLVILALLAYGNRKSEFPWRKLKNRLMLIGMLPPLVVVLSVVILQHFGIYVFNATATLPLAVTFFLAVTAYAIHRHRLFDIQFYIPGSKIRRRKTAFYNRIKNMIAEIAELKSINDVINRLADTLSCPVVLVTGNKPVIAAAANAQYMAKIPHKILSNIDHIVVANEISSEKPERFRVMQKYGIAAIVPFYPYSRHASGWLLLGESFSNQVYTSRDFRLTEQLFEKMADLFLDKLLDMRHQLEHSAKDLNASRLQESITNTKLEQAVLELADLKKINARLAGTQLADSTSIIDANEISSMFEGTVTLLSRDKSLLKILRKEFPQCVCYTGPDSASFRRREPADIFICQLPDKLKDKLSQNYLNLIEKQNSASAFLFYGEQARQWIQQHRQQLSGNIIDILPDETNKQLVFRKIRALRLLRTSLISEYISDYPYVAAQLQSQESLKRARYLADTGENIFILSQDIHEAESLATVVHYMTELNGPDKSLRLVNYIELDAMWRAGSLENYLDNLTGGSLIINLTADNQHTDEFNHDIKDQITKRNKKTRFFFIADNPTVANIPAQLLTLTPLSQREQDQQVLVHYYILQFNIQSVDNRYLSQSEVTDILHSLGNITLESIRSALLSKLGASSRSILQDEKLFKNGGLPTRALDEYVADYEKQLIKQTLQHCGGNKSQAARILGLRPNTLHYKLERYGLLEKEK